MARQWIPHMIREGRHSAQAHCDLPAGTYEREMGREGFFGPASHIHHRHPPTGWVDWQGPLRPYAFDLTRLEAASESPFAQPPFLANGDGAKGRALEIAIALERGEHERVDLSDMPTELLADLHLDATQWADGVMTELNLS